MSAPATVVAPDRHASYNKSRLFLASVIALVTAGMAASLRSNIAGDLQSRFLDPIDKAHSGEMIGNILGVPFLGFAFTIAIGSPLLDIIGMGSSVCHWRGSVTGCGGHIAADVCCEHFLRRGHI